MQVRAELDKRLSAGLHKKDAAREVAALANWPQRDVYRLAPEAGATAADLDDTELETGS